MGGGASKWWRAAESIDSGAGPGTVSFDFDDVLHYAPGGNPIDFWAWETYVPREPYISEAKRAADGGYRVIVVSHRDPGMEDVILGFAEMHGLHLDRADVFCVGLGERKLDALARERAEAHYDDNPDMANELRGSGIRLVRVPQTDESDLSWVPDEMRERFPGVYSRYKDYPDDRSSLPEAGGHRRAAS
jgi:hypothetical protein